VDTENLAQQHYESPNNISTNMMQVNVNQMVDTNWELSYLAKLQKEQLVSLNFNLEYKS
jgi:hypothetical protein